MAKKKTTKKKTAKKKATTKKSAKKKSTKKKSAKKKSTQKKSAKKKTTTKKKDPLEKAKLELRDSVENAVKAFAHIANVTEKEAVDRLLAIAPDDTEAREKLTQRKKKLQQADTENLASDILTQIRGVLKDHKIDFWGSSDRSSKKRQSSKDD